MTLLRIAVSYAVVILSLIVLGATCVTTLVKNVAYVSVLHDLKRSGGGTLPSVVSLESENLLRTALQLAPHDTSLGRTLGLVLLASGQMREVQDSWLGNETIGHFLFQKRHLIAASYGDATFLQWMRVAAKSSTTCRDSLYYLAMAASSYELYDEALASLQQAEARQCGDKVGKSDLYYQIGFLKQQRLSPRDASGAGQAYERALELNEFRYSWLKTQTHLQRGNLYMREGEWLRALEEYNLAFALEPNSPQIAEAVQRAKEKVEP